MKTGSLFPFLITIVLYSKVFEFMANCLMFMILTLTSSTSMCVVG